MKNKKFVTLGALAVAMLVGATGGTMLNALQADAQTPSTTTSEKSTAQSKESSAEKEADPTETTHVGANGKREELLTGATAEKVKTAALAAVKGGTIDRVETDAEGAAYEAHMTKSDGTRTTVKLDSSFKVTSTENGMR